MRQRIGRRLISIMLSVLMLVSLLPTAVFAEELQNQTTAGVTEQVGEGTGNTVGNSTENEDSTGGEEAKGESSTAYVAKVGGNEYATLEEAIAAAEPVNGVITYEIYGKAKVTSNDSWIQVLKTGLSNVTKVVFVGMTTDAEIIITNPTSVLADQEYDIDVSFEKLTLSHPNGEWVNDLGHTTNYFACLLRNTGAKENTVTYTNCIFPNGVCNNQYGKTVFDSCKFTNDAAGKYNLWNYGGNTEIKDSTFTGTRGIKAYNEGTLPVAPTVKVENTTFDGLTEKAAIVASKPVNIAVAKVDVTGEKGFITRDITGKDEVQLNVSGSQISGNFNITSEANAEAAKDEFNITGGTFNGAVSKDYLAENTELVYDEATDTYGVAAAKVASVGGTVYPTLEDAFAALSTENHTLTLIKADAWAESTPVYWAAGEQSGYAAKLTDALTAAYKANAGDITIVCRPGADVGEMTNGHVADNITIYGNDAYLSGGECDLEVDTYKFRRATGAQANGGEYLTHDIAINAYELDNLGVWGQRNTGYTINVNLTDCDGKAFDGVKNLQRVYISGTTGVNNITLKGCDFLTAATAVYSNADGKIVVEDCSFTGGAAPVNINHKGGGAVTVEVKGSKFTNCGSVKSGEKQYAAPIRFVNSGSGTMQATVDSCTITGTKGTNGDILIGDGRTNQASNDLSLTVMGTAGQVQVQKPGYWVTNNRKDPANETHFDVASNGTLETTIKKAFITGTTGTETDPYTLEQFNEMTRAEYIAAQERLGGTMYVTVGEYAYAKQGVLGNGTADNSDRDSTKLNYYGAPGAKEGQYSDAAVGKNVVFVGDSIENEVDGYTDIDKIGTSLLLAVPAYTNVTFKGIDFYGVFSFNYQLYTSPWSQLGSLNFEGCTFNGLIVGAIAAQTLAFNGCTFGEYGNSASGNNSNPIWVRPAYGNWTKDDNEGQGNDFRSLTTINFTNNTVTSTRPVKFERIAQWEMDTKVTATGNTFDIRNDGSGAKNVGMYFGANAKFDLVVDKNTASSRTAGLYTAVYSAPNSTNYPGLPAGSTVKDANGNNIEKGVPALEWKSTKPLTLKTTEEVAQLTTTKGVVVKFATLEKAIAEAKDGDTVTLLKSCSGNGIKIKTGNFATKGLTVDFGGCTYTVGGVLVGSSGTGTNAFQLLEGGKITFQNGTIEGVTEGTKPAEDTPNWHGAPAIVIQNYCDLTLKDMTVSGGDETVYTVSNNHGNVVIEDSTINAGKAKGYTSPAVAFDVCGYSTYDGVSVTVKGNSTINGDIEVSRSANNTKDVKLALESGTISGKLKIDSSIKNSTATTTVTKGGNVTVAAPVGYAWNTDGTLVAAVAQIGDVGYITLEAAIAAAASGDTVKLLKDVTEDVTISKGITLDLGGKTLTNTNAGKATISVDNGVTATAKNGSVVGGTSFYNIQVGKAVNSTANLTLENVTATAGNTGSSMIDNWGTLTIESGDYEGGLNVVKSEEGSKLTINGGKFTLNHAVSNNYNGVILSAGMTKITDGEFIQNATTTPKWAHPTVVLAMKVDGYDSKIVITGGKFTNKKSGEKIFHGSGKATSDNFEVSGGTFNKSISDGYCAEGFIPTKNADGTYGVKEGKYVAKIGSKNYETLADAIRLAAKSKTITLLANVTENVEITAAKNLTLDLNGYTLNGGTGTAKAALTNYGTITIKDSSTAKTGTIKRDDNGTTGETSYYVIRNQGTMTIESGTVINNSGYRKTNPTGSMIGSSLICNGDCDEGGTLTIKGGTFTQNNFIAIKNGALGVLHVSGGTISSDHSAIQNWFKADITGGEIKGQLWTDAWTVGESVGETKIGDDAKFTGEIVMDITGSVAPTLEITGGNLNVTNWRITNAAAKAGAKPAISGGTFNAPVKPEYCAPNHEPVDNGDGTYGVKLFYVAKIDGKEYKTLQEAFGAVSATGTIELLHDVTVTETLTFNKQYSESPTFLKMNGYTITGDGCRALQIVNGHLQIEGNGTPEEGKNVITSTGIGIASSVIRVGADDGRQNLSIANGVTVKTDCSYGITVFGGGTEFLCVENSKVISTAKHNADYDGCAIATLGTDKTSANVTIKNSAYIEAEDSNAIYMPSGSLHVYDGAIVRGLTGIYAKSGNVQIKDAKIYGTGEAKGYNYYGNGGIPTGDALVLDSCGYPNGAPTVDYADAKDAYFESTNAKPIGSYATTGNTKVTGFVDKGTFNKAIDKDLLADGYVCKYNAAEGNYGVATTENCVAKVGDIYYTALQDAIDAANSGDTVELVKDVNTPEVTYGIDKALTIDLNGKTVTGSGYDGVFQITDERAKVLIKNGDVVAVEGSGSAGNYAMAVWACAADCEVTLENLNVSQAITSVNDPQMDMIYTSAGTIIINSGSFESGTPAWTLNCKDAAYKDGTANIIVNGGTFKGFDPMNNQAEGKGTSFVNAEKHVGVNAAKSDDGTVSYSAVENMTAQVVDAEGKSVKAFEKLSDALTAVEAKQTVKLLNDVANETFVMVKAGVTLDLAGKNITGATMLYVTGTIVDTAASDTKGAVSAEAYMIASSVGSGYTPIYSGTGYQFYKLGMNIMTKDVSADGATVIFAPKTKNEWTAELNAFRTLLAPGFDTSKVQIVLEVEWGETNTHDSQRFAFNDQYVYKYATEDSWAFSVTMNGLNALSGKVTATAKIITYGADGREMTWLSSDAVTLKGE